MSKHLNKLNQAKYWDRNLDSQNLGKENSAHYKEVMRGKLFFDTPDQRVLFTGLNIRSGKRYLEIGCGLGLNVLDIAELGAIVYAIDISIERLHALRTVIEKVNPHLKVFYLLAKAEEMPFQQEVFAGISARAVLIHTDYEKVYDECYRVLGTQGRISIAEPMAANPFVNFYRKYFAPKEWADIATYFTSREILGFESRFQPVENSEPCANYFYFVSFLSYIFQYLFSMPKTFKVTLSLLMMFDSFLFRISPKLLKQCWFVVLTGKK